MKPLIILGIAIVAVIGWIANLWQTVSLGLATGPLTTLFVVKIIGIFFAPLGALLGWIGFFT